VKVLFEQLTCTELTLVAGMVPLAPVTAQVWPLGWVLAVTA